MFSRWTVQPRRKPWAEAGLWVAWGVPTRGRERPALDLLKHTITDYLGELVENGRIERFDTAILKPQTQTGRLHPDPGHPRSDRFASR